MRAFASCALLVGLTLTTAAYAAPCGTSLTPSFNNGFYIFHCTLNANLNVNNPSYIMNNGTLLLELIQPAPEPQTYYKVTMGSAYYQENSPASNTLVLSTKAGALDVLPGIGVAASSDGRPAHVDIVRVLQNMGP